LRMKLMVSNVPALYAIHPKDYYAETEIELKHAYAHQAIGFGNYNNTICRECPCNWILDQSYIGCYFVSYTSLTYSDAP
ncbi:unnamed protein product, partial [Rotaria socialis]